jgi:hypothetical protein
LSQLRVFRVKQVLVFPSVLKATAWQDYVVCSIYLEARDYLRVEEMSLSKGSSTQSIASNFSRRADLESLFYHFAENFPDDIGDDETKRLEDLVTKARSIISPVPSGEEIPSDKVTEALTLLQYHNAGIWRVSCHTQDKGDIKRAKLECAFPWRDWHFLCEGGEQCAKISKEYAWRDMRRILDDLGKEAVMDDVGGPMVIRPPRNFKMERLGRST